METVKLKKSGIHPQNHSVRTYSSSSKEGSQQSPRSGLLKIIIWELHKEWEGSEVMGEDWNANYFEYYLESCSHEKLFENRLLILGR